MKFRFLILLLKCCALLPLGLNRTLGRGLGMLAWYSRGRMRATTERNLELCFPAMEPAARAQLARASLQHTMQTVTESGPVWLWPSQRTLGLIRRVENLELLQQGLEEGRGVIVLAPHLGNWELLGLYLNACGLGQSYQLYQAPADPALGRLIFRARSRAGARMVATDNRGVAELLKALKSGCIAGILPDQVPAPGSGDYAPFYNRPALTMSLLNRLQQKTGARVVAAFAKRSEDREGAGFDLVFKAPDPKIYAEDMPAALEGLNRSIELLIAEAPEQYQWEYKRFRRQPEGTGPVYRR